MVLRNSVATSPVPTLRKDLRTRSSIKLFSIIAFTYPLYAPGSMIWRLVAPFPSRMDDTVPMTVSTIVTILLPRAVTIPERVLFVPLVLLGGGVGVGGAGRRVSMYMAVTKVGP